MHGTAHQAGSRTWQKNAEEGATQYWFWRHEWITDSSSDLALCAIVRVSIKWGQENWRCRFIAVETSGYYRARTVRWPPRMVIGMQLDVLSLRGKLYVVYSRAREMSCPSPLEPRRQWIPNVVIDLFATLNQCFCFTSTEASHWFSFGVRKYLTCFVFHRNPQLRDGYFKKLLNFGKCWKC